MTVPYPISPTERTRWIVEHRSGRNVVDPFRPYAFFREREQSESGEIVDVGTILLTNRECPWHCLMCDLWRNTLTDTVPLGAIPTQIDHALKALGHIDSVGRAALPARIDVESTPCHPLRVDPTENGSMAPDRAGGQGCPPYGAIRLRQIKLYNSGSFFDPRAIPLEDHTAIADRLRDFERVIVECHPTLVTEQILSFRDQLTPQLEVAMGLETAHPEILEKLNKRMTLGQFRRAADFLSEHDIALRVFVLVQPPFLDEAEALGWANRSTDFAFDCGATLVSLIPTRLGNGALETLATSGQFSEPHLATLEAAHAHGIALKRGRVFADLWDLQRFSSCDRCFQARRDRLERMNLNQTVEPSVKCECERER